MTEYYYTAPAVMICFKYDLWAIAKKYAPEPLLEYTSIKRESGFGNNISPMEFQSRTMSEVHFWNMTQLLMQKIKSKTPFFTGRLSAGIKELSPYPLRRFEGMTERTWQVERIVYWDGDAMITERYTRYFEMPDYEYITNVIYTKNVPYGKPVEIGSRAHVAPAQKLRNWSLGHPGPGWNEWTLQREIASDGTPPKFMFYNGMIQFELSMEFSDINSMLPTEFWEPYEIRYSSTRDGTIDHQGLGFNGF